MTSKKHTFILAVDRRIFFFFGEVKRKEKEIALSLSFSFFFSSSSIFILLLLFFRILWIIINIIHRTDESIRTFFSQNKSTRLVTPSQLDVKVSLIHYTVRTKKKKYMRSEQKGGVQIELDTFFFLKRLN